MKKIISSLILISMLIVMLVGCGVGEDVTPTVKKTARLEWDFYTPKSYYGVGDKLNVEGLNLIYWSNILDESTKVKVALGDKDVSISGFSTEQATTSQTAVVTYKGQTVSFDYSVYAYTTPDSSFDANARFISSTRGENMVFSFNKETKNITISSYATLEDFVNQNALETNSYKYEYYIVSDGTTSLRSEIDSSIYYFDVTSESEIEYILTKGSSQTNGKIYKYDASNVVYPKTTELYISQSKVADAGDKYVVIKFDTDYGAKIYLTDEIVNDVISLTPEKTLTKDRVHFGGNCLLHIYDPSSVKPNYSIVFEKSGRVRLTKYASDEDKGYSASLYASTESNNE